MREGNQVREELYANIEMERGVNRKGWMEIEVALLAREDPVLPFLLALIAYISLSHVQLKLMLMTVISHSVRQAVPFLFENFFQLISS